jgi:hypothetical protein
MMLQLHQFFLTAPFVSVVPLHATSDIPRHCDGVRPHSVYFPSICSLKSLLQCIAHHQALEHVYSRSVDPGEIRPELNHASNAAAVIGRRELTKGCSLERRAFLPSYDPYSDDEKGTNLERVLAPALVVGSGINLEYVSYRVESSVALACLVECAPWLSPLMLLLTSAPRIDKL